jgi:hypothetical protein
MSVTIDEFWIDTAHDYILQLTITHTHTHTSVHSHSGFPNYPLPQLPASHSNSSQRLNLSNSLTD